MNKFEEFVSVLVSGEKYTLVGNEYKEKITLLSANIDTFTKYTPVIYLLFKDNTTHKTVLRILFEDTLPVVHEGHI